MRVMFAGSRWLGLRVLEELASRRDINVIGAYCQGRGWEPTDLGSAAECLGVRVLSEESLGFALAAGDADLCVSCCTSHIFTAPQIAGCRLGIINLHPAPLPYYRGCNSYTHAILNGERIYGVSLHYVDEGIDTGPIIARDWLPIEPTDTGRALYDRAQAVAANMFHRELDRIAHWGTFGQRIPDVLAQDDSQARYFRRDSLNDLRDLTGLDDVERALRVRALTFPPFPVPA